MSRRYTEAQAEAVVEVVRLILQPLCPEGVTLRLCDGDDDAWFLAIYDDDDHTGYEAPIEDPRSIVSAVMHGALDDLRGPQATLPLFAQREG